MRSLFDYYDENSIKGIKVVIGNFVSHNINWTKNGELLSVEEVNNLDRMKLAEEFYKFRTRNRKYKSIGEWYKKTREFEECELMNDIAQFIDLKIPKNYWIKLYEKKAGKYKDRSKISKLYKGIDTVEGLNFIYKDNYTLEFYW